MEPTRRSGPTRRTGPRSDVIAACKKRAAPPHFIFPHVTTPTILEITIVLSNFLLLIMLRSYTSATCDTRRRGTTPLVTTQAALRRTRRVDGIEVDVHCSATPSERCAPPRRRPVISAAASTPLEAHAAAPGVPERGDGVQASAGVLRPRNTGGARSRPPSSLFHQYPRHPAPTRSE